MTESNDRFSVSFSRIHGVDEYYENKRTRFFADTFVSRAMAQRAEHEFESESILLADARKVLTSAIKNSSLLWAWNE